MKSSKFEGLLRRVISSSEKGHGFLWFCMLLSLCGTSSAIYPVTAVVIPAALLAPGRWWQITITAALGSALGATLLVSVFHALGWSQIYEYFPELATHKSWIRVMEWATSYGVLALFLIAVSPLPQTPALVFFGVARQDYLVVFAAMLSGKLIKYGVLAYLVSRFPEQFKNGIGDFLNSWRRRI